MSDFAPEELSIIGETYQRFHARTGEAMIKTPISLQALLAELEIKLAHESDVTQLFNKFGDVKGYMTFHDLIETLRDIKVSSTADAAVDSDEEDENIDEIDCEQALVEMGLPEDVLREMVTSVVSEVGARSVRTRRATMAHDALCASHMSDTTDSSDHPVEVTAATTRKMISELGAGIASKWTAHSGTPYKAFRQSATVVSSGATSALAGSLHSEVLLMRSLRTNNVSNKIQTPLPLPKFYKKRPGHAASESDVNSGQSSLQTTQQLKFARSASIVDNSNARTLSDLKETTQLLTCSKGSAVAYTGHMDEKVSDMAEASTISAIVPSRAPQQAGPLPPTSAVCRGSLRRTHRQMTPQTMPSGLKEASFIPVTRHTPLGSSTRPGTVGSSRSAAKLVPTSRIVKRIVEVDRAVFNPKKQSAPATINRILGVIDVEAGELYYAGSERARLKSPYTGVSTLVSK